MSEKTYQTVCPNVRALYQKAVAAVERHNLDYALDLFRQCLRTEPNFTEARQCLRGAQMRRNESAGGFKRALAAAKTAPLLTKAKMAVTKDPIEAMDLAEQVLCEDPKHSQALLILAEAAEGTGYPETVIQVLEHLTKINPKDTKAFHWLARTYKAMGKYDQSQQIYEQLLRMNAADFEAQKGLKDATAQVAMQKGGWDQSDSYRDVLKDKEAAITLEQQSRVVRAEDMIDNLLQETLRKYNDQPDNPVIQRELGKLYNQKGEYDTALKYLEEIIASEAGADPSLEREIAQIRANKIEAKINVYRARLADNPSDPHLIEEEIGKLEKEKDLCFLEQMNRLVERYPNDLMYRYELGVICMRAGNTQGAIEQLQKAVSQPQKRIQSLNYLGQCFFDLGLHDLAADQFLKAIEELPLMDQIKKDVTYHLGLTYEALGEHEKAVAEYKKIAAVDFSFRDVREKITHRPPQKVKH